MKLADFFLERHLLEQIVDAFFHGLGGILINVLHAVFVQIDPTLVINVRRRPKGIHGKNGPQEKKRSFHPGHCASGEGRTQMVFRGVNAPVRVGDTPAPPSERCPECLQTFYAVGCGLINTTNSPLSERFCVMANSSAGVPRKNSSNFLVSSRARTI